MQKISHFSYLSAPGYTPKWKYFHLLEFMKDYLSPVTRMMQGNLQTNDEEDSLQSLVSTVLEEPDDDALLSQQVVKRGRRNVIGQHLINLEKEKLQLLEESMEFDKTMEESRIENADLNFFKSLLPYMEEFSTLEKLELRQDIQRLIIDKYKKKIKENTCDNLKENHSKIKLSDLI